MALSQPALKQNLLSLFNLMKQTEMSEEDYADRLATIINNHIKTATVTVNPGIAVTTPSGPGSTNEPGTGTLS
jgi:translation initiation factor 2 alpha subunit (eIF-2alpha)